MEHPKDGDTFINLLPYFKELISRGEFDILRQTFYYNFDNLTINTTDRRGILIFLLNEISLKLGVENTKELYNILRIKKLFCINYEEILEYNSNLIKIISETTEACKSLTIEQ